MAPLHACRILVTGGAGFIGSHLVEALLNQGYQVRVLDNLSSGKLHNLPMNNPSLRVTIGDVADLTTVEQAVTGCSAVVHLAAVASVQASVDDPVGTHHSNFAGTLNVCEAMLKASVKRVVFASSAAIYGNNGEGISVNEDIAKSPLTPYASDKLAGEYYLDFYRREHGLEPVILRFFNIFGPRQDPSSPYSGVISIFTLLAVAGQQIKVFGDGSQTRDFVFVTDLVGVIRQAVAASAPPNEPVNVGLGRSTSLNQIIEELASIIGIVPNVAYLEPRAGDIQHSRADTTRLRTHFSLPDPVSVREGLAQLIRSL